MVSAKAEALKAAKQTAASARWRRLMVFLPKSGPRLFCPRYKINLSRPHEAVKRDPASTRAKTVLWLGPPAELDVDSPPKSVN